MAVRHEGPATFHAAASRPPERLRTGDPDMTSFGRRHSLLGHPIPAEELGPPHGRLTGPKTAGPRRGYRVPHARATTGVGALYTPGTAVLIPAGGDSPTGACRITAARPFPRPQHPTWRGSHNEASTRVQAIHPSGLPLACRRPDGTSSRLGFPPSFAPRRPGAGQRTPGWGQAIEHGPGTTRSTSSWTRALAPAWTLEVAPPSVVIGVDVA